MWLHLQYVIALLVPWCILLAISARGAEVNGTKPKDVVPSCADMFKTDGVMSRTDQRCKPDTLGNVYYNLPILDGVYCYNNGTGICKAFAGRFEFLFNVWSQEFLGPVPESEDVDTYGYHRRVPHSYTPEGRVLYADRAINWSREFTKSKPTAYNLLSATSFNWCKYATTSNWPYKSSILDHDGVHQIFFFNRQSCIYNPKTKEVQHYNTRFLDTSQLRIDLDYNPTIFAMEDNLANGTRLVKHKRQHWFEVSWELQKQPKENIMYFVKMEKEERRPLIVDGQGPLLRAQMYNKTTDLCVSDYLASRRDSQGAQNSRLVSSGCGIDQSEIALHFKLGDLPDEIFDIGLHSIPRVPKESQSFYGVDIKSNAEWEKFASDGYSFSATTTIPLANDIFEVISLLSYYKGNGTADPYDEHYPPTYLLRYNMTHSWDKTNHKWSGIENRNISGTKPLLNLNYVDDIAYLPECNTILVIFGPLYTEFPVNEFNLDKRTPLGSIHDLGANEMVEAFFAIGNKLYFYHRLNYVAEHTYTCGGKSRAADGDGNPLVTATRNGPYKFRHGPGKFDFMPSTNNLYNHYEERHFQLTGMFEGEIIQPEAPDASQIQWDAQDPRIVPPDYRGPPNSIYWLIGAAALGLLLMVGVGCIAFRNQAKRRRRRLLLKTQRSELPDLSQLSAFETNRSGMMANGGGNRQGSAISTATVRSGQIKDARTMPSSATGLYGGSQQSSTATGRSSMTSRANSPKRSDTGTTRSSNIISAIPVSPRKSRSKSTSTSRRRKAQLPGSPIAEDE